MKSSAVSISLATILPHPTTVVEADQGTNRRDVPDEEAKQKAGLLNPLSHRRLRPVPHAGNPRTQHNYVDPHRHVGSQSEKPSFVIAR